MALSWPKKPSGRRPSGGRSHRCPCARPGGPGQQATPLGALRPATPPLFKPPVVPTCPAWGSREDKAQKGGRTGRWWTRRTWGRGHSPPCPKRPCVAGRVGVACRPRAGAGSSGAGTCLWAGQQDAVRSSAPMSWAGHGQPALGRGLWPELGLCPPPAGTPGSGGTWQTPSRTRVPGPALSHRPLPTELLGPPEGPPDVTHRARSPGGGRCAPAHCACPEGGSPAGQDVSWAELSRSVTCGH